MGSNSKYAFFRQSGWLVIATFSGGIFMTLVHSVAVKMGNNDYAVFNTLLRLLIVLGGVPSAALQNIFAQHAAAAVTEHKQQDLAVTTRAILRCMFYLWAATGLFVVLFTKGVQHFLDIGDPLALLLTALIILPTLTVPVFKGLLQGEHHFAGLGWLQIIDGVGRFFAMLLIVFVLKAAATGAMVAVLTGLFATLLTGVWLTRHIWMMKTSVKMHWRRWMARAIPLTLAMGAVIAMTSIDTLFVQNQFGSGGMTELYVGAMITGYAIIQFIAPVAQVMFPQIVRSAALSQKSNALLMTVASTALFGCVVAVACAFLPSLPLRVIFFSKPHMWDAAPLVPWFALGLLPLTLANVLIQNLLAKERFAVAASMSAVPVIYAVALYLFAPTLHTLPLMTAFTRVVQIMGCFNLLLFAAAVAFSWKKPVNAVSGQN